jgi:pyruvate/2-oxoglutarate/acetoin dehydrogenase E1 component
MDAPQGNRAPVGMMATYREELARAMEAIAAGHPRAIFLGQAVAEKGTGMSATFDGVPREKLLELPVMEDAQLGMSIGLALDGWLPVSIYPRWSFLILAMNQLVLHLDRMPLFSDYCPKVIIRTACPTDDPMDPGEQHMGDFSHPVALMLKTVKVRQLRRPEQVSPEYAAAMTAAYSTILVEYPEKYDETL